MGGPQSSRRGCNLFAAFITVLADTAGHVTHPLMARAGRCIKRSERGTRREAKGEDVSSKGSCVGSVFEENKLSGVVALPGGTDVKQYLVGIIR